MEINNKKQYNQGIGKYKILSSTAGVGALVTTKWGGFVMPLSISDWQFVKTLSEEIKKPENSNHTLQQLQGLSGVEIIDDSRFVEFLKQKKQLTALKCFVAVPHIQLDKFNQIDKDEHPIYKKKQELGVELKDEMFIIPAINFPKWFISNNFDMKPIEEWQEVWKAKRCNDGKMDYFAPPRDPNKKTYRTFKNSMLNDKNIYGLLKPVPMVLICSNGHISDIPWYHYFCAKLANEKIDKLEGFDLFNYDCEPCSNASDGHHQLQWITNRNQSESWGTLKCARCNGKVSLAGIMNIKPFCRGERPWDLENRREICTTGHDRTIMQMVLVTSNSIYYANCLSSFYIPDEYIERAEGQLTTEANKMLQKILDKIFPRYERRSESPSKEDFWRKMFDEGDTLRDAADDDEIELTDNDWNALKQSFINPEETEEVDVLATYRYNEYQVFAKNTSTPGDKPGLRFENIILSDSLKGYFTKIQKVDTLAITSTQLGFSRVSMPSAKIVGGKVIYPDDQIKPIYTCNKDEVLVLPANQLFGEGIFFMFDESKVNQWADNHNLEKYFQCNLSEDDMGKFMSDEMEQYGRARFYLLHTFSHIIMKELEFSCGYPTASLNERLYYSDKMSGVLIYTADGAEGSMGGLVWQAQPHLIERIIKTAMNRALNCSSDPMCWENEDGLNRASCFSCTMISETSCEQRNLGLDRRALVDTKFGYFKDLV